MRQKGFWKGLADGMPICLGYISVAFAFGIFAVNSGLGAKEALLLSMTNVTSAGQFAAVPILVGGGTFAELALTQFVINLRYALMSVSLSQKFDGSIRLYDRFALAFVNTDEVFAVASSQEGKVSRGYMYGLILMPYFGWSVGTLAGALAGNELPPMLTAALSIAIYGMFIAIVLPPAKHHRPTALCVLLAAALSCVFYFMPVLRDIPSGFTVIVCAVLTSALCALCFPLSVKQEEASQ